MTVDQRFRRCFRVPLPRSQAVLGNALGSEALLRMEGVRCERENNSAAFFPAYNPHHPARNRVAPASAFPSTAWEREISY